MVKKISIHPGSIIGGVWHRPVGLFYQNRFNRFLIYLLGTLLMGGWTFLALTLYERYRWYLIPVSFKGVYSWHTMANFGLCLMLFDEIVGRLTGPWGRFENRTLGKEWLLWSGSFLVAFAIQRTLVFEGIMYYALDLYHYYETYPEMRPSATRHFVACVPFFTATLGILGAVAAVRQRSMEKEKGVVEALTEELAEKEGQMQQARSSVEAGKPAPIQLLAGSSHIFLDPGAITHVTVEDHYCRIFIAEEGRPASHFVKSSLAALMEGLPNGQFLQIHRSHLVNLDAVRKVERKSRSHEIHLTTGDVLPLSRHRASEVMQRLESVVAPG